MATIKLRIGVVGFSRPHFDHSVASTLIAKGIQHILQEHNVQPIECELVSGLTNVGIPKLAYEYASSLNMRTVGVSARSALRARCGIYPVDQQVIVGNKYGDESQTFVNSIDVLLRVGGGPQSRHEVELFKERYKGDAPNALPRLFEYELDYHGK